MPSRTIVSTDCARERPAASEPDISCRVSGSERAERLAPADCAEVDSHIQGPNAPTARKHQAEDQAALAEQQTHEPAPTKIAMWSSSHSAGLQRAAGASRRRAMRSSRVLLRCRTLAAASLAWVSAWSGSLLPRRPECRPTERRCRSRHAPRGSSLGFFAGHEQDDQQASAGRGPGRRARRHPGPVSIRPRPPARTARTRARTPDSSALRPLRRPRRSGCSARAASVTVTVASVAVTGSGTCGGDQHLAGQDVGLPGERLAQGLGVGVMTCRRRPWPAAASAASAAPSLLDGHHVDEHVALGTCVR